MIVRKVRVPVEVHIESIDWLAAFASASATMPTTSTASTVAVATLAVAALSMLTVAMTTAATSRIISLVFTRVITVGSMIAAAPVIAAR